MCPDVACFRNGELLRMPPTATPEIKPMSALPTSMQSTIAQTSQKLRWPKLDQIKGSHSEKPTVKSRDNQSQIVATSTHKDIKWSYGMDL